MARLVQCGFELGDFDNNLEFPAHTGSTAAIVSVNSTTVHAGSYSLKFTGASTTTAPGPTFYTQTDPTTAGPSNDFFIRFYFYVENTVQAINQRRIFQAYDSGGATFSIHYWEFYGQLDVHVGTTTGGTLLVSTGVDDIVRNSWNRIEMRVEWISSASKVHLRVNGVDFGSGTFGSSATLDSLTKFDIGRLHTIANAGVVYYIDDVAVNDSNGSRENSWCGDGYIVHLKPNGDITAEWSLNAGTGTNNSRVDEVTPDDATTYVKRTTGTVLDEYSLESPTTLGIGFYQIKVVAASARIGATSNTTGNRTAYIRLKYSGSTHDSNLLNWSINGWATNDEDNIGSLYPLVSYTTPTAANWTSTILESTSLQIETAVSASQEVRVSAVWASVEYSTAGDNRSNFFVFFNRHS